MNSPFIFTGIINISGFAEKLVENGLYVNTAAECLIFAVLPR